MILSNAKSVISLSVLTEAPTIEDYQDPEHPLKKKQMVMELDEETWRVSGYFLPHLII